MAVPQRITLTLLQCQHFTGHESLLKTDLSTLQSYLITCFLYCSQSLRHMHKAASSAQQRNPIS